MFSEVITSSAVPTWRILPGLSMSTTWSANIEAMFRLWLIIMTMSPLATAISCISDVMNIW